MAFKNERWIKLGEWWNKNKIPFILTTVTVLAISIHNSYEEKTQKQPQTVTYREYIMDLQEGLDTEDEKGNPVVKPDKVDTVYYDLGAEEWRYTVWNETSRLEYETWINEGNNAADFYYDYSPDDWRIVKITNMASEKLDEHIDKYAGLACRSIEWKRFKPFYLDVLPAIGSTLLMFSFMFAMFGIYAKKMSDMGGIKKKLLVKDTGVRFYDVIGHDEIIDDLKLIVDLMKANREEAELERKNKFSPNKILPSKPKEKFSAYIPRGMLFSGEAGTGKTMLAKAIAGEAGVPFLYMNASGFVEMYVGVGAKRVRDLFKLARKHSPCIIFIDEIDAVGLDRNGNINSEQKQTINALLQEMDGFDTKAGIFIIAATNNPDSLDKALVRSGRFDRQVVIAPPRDYKVRMKLFEQYLKGDPVQANLENIARQCVGFTGADVNAICNEARLIAKAKKADYIDDDILEEALDRKVFKGNRVREKNKHNEEINIVAHHEAGHALTSLLLDVPVSRATIIGTTGGVGGAVFNIDSSKTMLSKTDAQKKIMIAYGGRAAEEVMYGASNVTTGASNDFVQATELLKGYVSDYGFDNNVISLTALYGAKNSQGETTSRIMELGNDFYQQTVDLLTVNKHKLQILAEELIKKETMTGEEIANLIGKKAEA